MKAIRVIFIVLICVMLVIPVLTSDFSKTYSPLETRPLTGVPKTHKANGDINYDFFKQYGNRFADHIGMRDQMIGLYSEIMVNGFGLSSSPKIEFGKDDWMFYTNENNIDIGTGKFMFNDAELKLIADNQQAISDYYKSIGKEYVLIFTPSKASVYTEYVFGNYEVCETIIDQVTDYLLENTDVKVINVKDAELEAKDKGQLFLKTDTHWTQLGTYYAYLDIVDKLNNFGLDIGTPVVPEFEPLEVAGEFSHMLGKNGVLKPEKVYNAVWDTATDQFTDDGDPAIKAITDFNSNVTYMAANTQQPVLFRNTEAQSDLKVLTYVDSMWRPDRGLPKYLSENFSEIVYTRMRTIDTAVDELYDADVVIWSMTERFIPTLAGMPCRLPSPSEDNYDELIASYTYKEYPKFDTWTGRHGFSLNSENAQGIPISAISDGELCKLRGWAVDFTENTAADDVYIRVGGRTFKALYGMESDGVVNTFGYEAMRYCVFEANIPAEYFKPGETISFIMVNRKTGTTYTPAEYTLAE